MIKLRYFAVFFYVSFFWSTVLCMEGRRERRHEDTTLLNSQEPWSTWQKVSHGLYIGGVTTLAFTGQYLTIQNYYEDHPQADDLTGVWSGAAVALSIGAIGALFYVSGKYVIDCRGNRGRQASHSVPNEDEEL